MVYKVENMADLVSATVVWQEAANQLEQWCHNMEKYRRETALADQEDPKGPLPGLKWEIGSPEHARQDRTNLSQMRYRDRMHIKHEHSLDGVRRIHP